MGEQADGCTTPGNCSSGACLPCPETAGSDCSRCANPPPAMPGYGRLMFEPPCDKECLHQRPSVLDVVKEPAVAAAAPLPARRRKADVAAVAQSNRVLASPGADVGAWRTTPPPPRPPLLLLLLLLHRQLGRSL